MAAPLASVSRLPARAPRTPLLRQERLLLALCARLSAANGRPTVLAAPQAVFTSPAATVQGRQGGVPQPPRGCHFVSVWPRFESYSHTEGRLCSAYWLVKVRSVTVRSHLRRRWAPRSDLRYPIRVLAELQGAEE